MRAWYALLISKPESSLLFFFSFFFYYYFLSNRVFSTYNETQSIFSISPSHISTTLIFSRLRIHAEENKRRTLQRSDIATAITKTDMFDFLIDIVPREEVPRLPAVKAEKIEGQEVR